MEYNKVIAVTGLPGLYELLSSKTDGAIVRSLDDKSTKFVSSRIHNFSHLESIEIYTVRENVNLVDVLKSMESSGEKLPDEKDGAALKSYFSKVYPDLDFDRVYSSDLKKMIRWYSILKANDIEIKLTEMPEEEPVEVEEAAEAAEKPRKAKAAVAETAVEEKPKAKKAAVKEEAEEKPKAVKKSAEKADAEEKPKAKKAAATEEKAAPKKKAEKDEPAEKPKKAAPKKK